MLALTALQADGTMVPQKIRDLVQIFRPNQKGNLTLVDFCKSIDSLYKELRLLRASVRNSQKIDHSFEQIFNVVFYTVLIFICLALLGFDPLALFLSLSSFALAFSFMISRASSNYFDVSYYTVVYNDTEARRKLTFSGISRVFCLFYAVVRMTLAIALSYRALKVYRIGMGQQIVS